MADCKSTRIYEWVVRQALVVDDQVIELATTWLLSHVLVDLFQAKLFDGDAVVDEVTGGLDSELSVLVSKRNALSAN